MKREKKNPHREKKKCREGRAFSSKLPLRPFIFGSCFYLPTSVLLFQTFSHGIFFFLNKRKKRKTQRKKNHKEEKKCRKGRELTFLLSLLHLG
jgi:hypothetical protein